MNGHASAAGSVFSAQRKKRSATQPLRPPWDASAGQAPEDQSSMKFTSRATRSRMPVALRALSCRASACSWQSPQSEEAYACTDTVVVALLAATAATTASKNTALRMVLAK